MELIFVKLWSFLTAIKEEMSDSWVELIILHKDLELATLISMLLRA